MSASCTYTLQRALCRHTRTHTRTHANRLIRRHIHMGLFCAVLLCVLQFVCFCICLLSATRVFASCTLQRALCRHTHTRITHADKLNRGRTHTHMERFQSQFDRYFGHCSAWAITGAATAPTEPWFVQCSVFGETSMTTHDWRPLAPAHQSWNTNRLTRGSNE